VGELRSRDGGVIGRTARAEGGGGRERDSEAATHEQKLRKRVAINLLVVPLDRKVV
jgi:hypothetical protein